MKIYRVTILVAALLMTGCAGHQMKQLPDGRWLSATTAKDSVDRSATYVQVLKRETNKDGSVSFKEVAGDLTVGSTVAGDVIRGVTVGTGAAYIQGEAGKSIANTRANATKCPDGTTNCYSTVINVDGASASAGSSAASGSSTDVVIQSGSIPMD